MSVHLQADTERADLARERAELEQSPAAEHRELAAIYVARGVEQGLAARVGGASGWVRAARVTFWGTVAMAITAGVGRWFGTVV